MAMKDEVNQQIAAGPKILTVVPLPTTPKVAPTLFKLGSSPQDIIASTKVVITVQKKTLRPQEQTFTLTDSPYKVQFQKFTRKKRTDFCSKALR